MSSKCHAMQSLFHYKVKKWTIMSTHLVAILNLFSNELEHFCFLIIIPHFCPTYVFMQTPSPKLKHSILGPKSHHWSHTIKSSLSGLTSSKIFLLPIPTGRRTITLHDRHKVGFVRSIWSIWERLIPEQNVPEH